MEFISFQFDVVIDLVSRGGLWCMLSKVCHLILIIVGGSFENKSFCKANISFILYSRPTLIYRSLLIPSKNIVRNTCSEMFYACST